MKINSEENTEFSGNKGQESDFSICRGVFGMYVEFSVFCEPDAQ